MTIRALRRKPMPLRTGFAPTLPALFAALLLAGCDGGPAAPLHGDNAQIGAASEGGRMGSRSIPCGPRAGELEKSCVLEVEDRKGDLHLTLRQPDGGFRRLLWPKGGTLAAADGAEALETTALNGGGVEARIGGWRYRIEKKDGGLP